MALNEAKARQTMNMLRAENDKNSHWAANLIHVALTRKLDRLSADTRETVQMVVDFYGLEDES